MSSWSDASRYQSCLVFSLLLHGTAFAGSVLLFSNLRLAEAPEPFRWNVGMVEGSSAIVSPAAKPNAFSPSNISPETPPRHAADNKPDRPKPAPRPAVTVQERTPDESISSSPMKQERPAAIHRADSGPVDEPHGVPPTTLDSLSGQTTGIPASPDLLAAAHENEVSARHGSSVNSEREAPEEAPRSSSPHEEAPAVASVQDEQRPGPSSTEVASLAPSGIGQDRDGEATAPRPSPGRQDLGWLGEALRNRLQESHKYSAVARLNGLEGRVVLRVTVRENGELLVALGKSSGHEVLDRDAVEAVQRLSPLRLNHPLGRTQQSLNLPITYTLDR